VTFLSLVLKNLLRQRVRTLLTVVGITVGIATVVALGAVTAGMKGTADDFITAGGAQFIVAQKGAADLSFSRLDATVLPRVAAVTGVGAVSGVQLEILKVGSNPFFFLGGVEPSMLRSQGLDLTRGRLPRAGDEVVLGVDAAADLGAGVGSTVTLGRTPLTVVGVYDSQVSLATRSTARPRAGRPARTATRPPAASPGRCGVAIRAGLGPTGNWDPTTTTKEAGRWPS